MKEKILIVCKIDLGSHTDLYKWCYYLRDEYDVSLICLDTKYEKVQMEGVKVHYVSCRGSRILKGIRYVLSVLWRILWFKGKIMVVYFEHCKVIKKVFPRRRMLLDIRTLAISPDETARRQMDNDIVSACKCFDVVSVISEGVKKKIGDVGRKVHILPLGADCISDKQRDYSKLRLLYVGTFAGRDIDKTIKGVNMFLREHPSVDIKYDIIGSGYGNELEDYRKLVKDLGLTEIITLHGRVANHLLQPYFDEANIGVSFVPITDYYNVQPPTKTFEYVLSGLYTIVTATDANREIITQANGILIEDSPQAFASALEQVLREKENIDELEVRASLSAYNWANIVNKCLKPILQEC